MGLQGQCHFTRAIYQHFNNKRQENWWGLQGQGRIYISIWEWLYIFISDLEFIQYPNSRKNDKSLLEQGRAYMSTQESLSMASQNLNWPLTISSC